MGFLVSELWSILYFTVVNCNMGLRCLAGKQLSLALQNMSLTITCNDLGVNLFRAWGQSPQWRLMKPPTRIFFFFKFQQSPSKIYTKFIISEKLRITQKKSFMVKMSAQSIQSTLRIWPIWEEVEFLRAQNTTFEWLQCSNAI